VFEVSQLLVTKANIVVGETKTIRLVQVVKLCISFFELWDGFSELDVVHK